MPLVRFPQTNTLDNEAGFPQKEPTFWSNKVTEKYSEQWLAEERELHLFCEKGGWKE